MANDSPALSQSKLQSKLSDVLFAARQPAASLPRGSAAVCKQLATQNGHILRLTDKIIYGSDSSIQSLGQSSRVSGLCDSSDLRLTFLERAEGFESWWIQHKHCLGVSDGPTVEFLRCSRLLHRRGRSIGGVCSLPLSPSPASLARPTARATACAHAVALSRAFSASCCDRCAWSHFCAAVVASLLPLLLPLFMSCDCTSFHCLSVSLSLCSHTA